MPGQTHIISLAVVALSCGVLQAPPYAAAFDAGSQSVTFRVGLAGKTAQLRFPSSGAVERHELGPALEITVPAGERWSVIASGTLATSRESFEIAGGTRSRSSESWWAKLGLEYRAPLTDGLAFYAGPQFTMGEGRGIEQQTGPSAYREEWPLVHQYAIGHRFGVGYRITDRIGAFGQLSHSIARNHAAGFIPLAWWSNHTEGVIGFSVSP